MIERTLLHWRELPNLSLEEASAVLGVSQRTVRNLLDAGDLVPHRIGRRQFVTVESVRRVAGDWAESEEQIPSIPPVEPHLSGAGKAAFRKLRQAS